MAELMLIPGVYLYFMTLTALLGLAMGSFLDCVASRFVRGESALKGRSRCDACGHVLGALELVPVLSWLALRGRCRSCGAKIGVRCPLTELLCAVIYCSLVGHYGFTLRALGALILASALLVISLVDLDTQTVPGGALIAGLIGFAVWLAGAEAPVRELLFSLWNDALIVLPLFALVLVFDQIMKKESMGGGDLKLFALVGLFFPWQQNLLMLILSCVLGLIFAALLGRARPGTPFPFAPAICAAWWLTALFGARAVTWYLSLFF